ncbi:hypothetical protein D3C86_1759120 [compost metagenome]
MLLNKVKLGGLNPIKCLPWGCMNGSLIFAKAEKKVAGKCLDEAGLLHFSRELRPDRISLGMDRSVKSARPFVVVVNVSHLSGLRSLFVWKQKATTEIPDTFTANF